jgi:light-regulated signal transduction histidine kinase (bacteriophytochrome)
MQMDGYIGTTNAGMNVLLNQLFYNLLNNSLKFSKTDVSSIIDITSERIQDGRKELVKITLQDNGIGFDKDYQEKIFHTFIRLNSKDEYEGTGLGLALCKKIVQRHNGTIIASGKINEGAIFTITLPVQQIKTNV